MAVKLVVCDIDNTLVVKRMPLSERARNVILEFKKRGILFGLASGRNVDSLHNLEQQWGIKSDVIIGLNGAELYDGFTGENKLYYVMKAEWLKECFDIMAPFEANVTKVINGIQYVRKLDENSLGSAAYATNNKIEVVKDDSMFYQTDSPKIGFRVKAEDMEAIEKAAAAHPSPYYQGFKTETTMFEFCPIEASKGKLLIEFCQRHDIDMNDVWAFGDMTNDITLLQASGNAVCMINGSDDCKAVANYITEKPVTEDGFADFCEKHLLKQ